MILARHGESEYSARGLGNGDPSVPVHLTERGREQARELGRELAGEAIELAISSEFLRTRETAELALTGREVPRLLDTRWNDIRYGELEGKPRDVYRAWRRQHDLHTPLPGGGESPIEVMQRSGEAVRAVLDRPEATILVVTHELLIKLICNAAVGLDPDADREIAYATPYRLTPDEAARAATRLAAAG